jgi:hypothetical protein
VQKCQSKCSWCFPLSPFPLMTPHKLANLF